MGGGDVVDVQGFDAAEVAEEGRDDEGGQGVPVEDVVIVGKGGAVGKAVDVERETVGRTGLDSMCW